jgi:hypothetical protein
LRLTFQLPGLPSLMKIAALVHLKCPDCIM